MKEEMEEEEGLDLFSQAFGPAFFSTMFNHAKDKRDEGRQEAAMKIIRVVS
jgi:hypothetical protein